jgi:hypothetical protein
MSPPSDYAWDVFFSYKRHDLTLNWTRWVYTRLRFWLTQELGVPEAKLFMDEDCIGVGGRWPERLKDGVRLSKCIVAVWSPFPIELVCLLVGKFSGARTATQNAISRLDRTHEVSRR